MIKNLLWVLLVILVILNVIPVGNTANKSLSGNNLLVFRLDYLIHAIMILFFAVIWLYGKIKGINWFGNQDALKYSLIVIGAAIGLELIQAVIPWRSFNPVDMEYNLVGAVATMIIVLISQRDLRKHRNCNTIYTDITK